MDDDTDSGLAARADRIQQNFSDIHPPLVAQQAAVEASRCYFCYDAPCIEACPTGINIPSFIGKIRSGNLTGSAQDIFNANIFGGICARVCPTEVLCERACVRNTCEEKPVAIGALQRYATDPVIDDVLAGTAPHPYTRGSDTGKTVAVIGAGPAGLAAAHELAKAGHQVVVFEAKPKAGGLNEYGIAAYKVADDFAAREVRFVTAIGGIEIRYGEALGANIDLADLRRDYDAVFLALGQAGVKLLGLPDEGAQNIEAAIQFIARLRQTSDLATLPVGDRVVVIGGGNTAIDAAVQSKRLGAGHVLMLYRRGPESMTATVKERDFALLNGVDIRYWTQPNSLLVQSGVVRGIRCEGTQRGPDGGLTGTGAFEVFPADQIFKAIGQSLMQVGLSTGNAADIAVVDGRIQTDGTGQTSCAGVWAGGDCVTGLDLTVQAVEDGKTAARAICRALAGEE